MAVPSLSFAELADGELLACLTAEVGDLFHVPRGIALRVFEVSTPVRGRGAVEIAEGIELLGGVGVVDVPPIPRHLVDAVLHAVDGSRGGVLVDADFVAHAPGEEEAVLVEVVGLGGVEVRLVMLKALIWLWPVSMSEASTLMLEVLPRVTTSKPGAERERRRVRVVWSELAIRVMRVVGSEVFGVLACIVVPSEDCIGAGSVQGLAIVRQRDAMVQGGVPDDRLPVRFRDASIVRIAEGKRCGANLFLHD